MNEKQRMKISRIENGTVIDHIRPGSALEVFDVLDLRRDGQGSITIGIRVESAKHGTKDLLKLENRFLSPTESALVALISPEATINIIREFEVQDKHPVDLPEVWSGIFRCDNPTCISNQEREPVEAEFEVKEKQPLVVRCLYCGTLMDESQITRQLLDD